MARERRRAHAIRGGWRAVHNRAHSHAASANRDSNPNDVGTIRLRTGSDVVVDPYDRIRGTGGFILVDEQTNDTVAAGMVR